MSAIERIRRSLEIGLADIKPLPPGACDDCGGQGAIVYSGSVPDYDKCDPCDGTGWVRHEHDGFAHHHAAVPGDDHRHPEYDVPASPGNEPAVWGCTIPACNNDTPRRGQPCDPCDIELGVGA